MKVEGGERREQMMIGQGRGQEEESRRRAGGEQSRVEMTGVVRRNYGGEVRRGERRGKEGRSKEMIGDERGGQCKEERRAKYVTWEAEK